MINGLFEFALVNEYTNRNVAREIRTFGRSFFDSRGRFDARETHFEFQDAMADDEDVNEQFHYDECDDTEDFYLQFFSAEEQAQLITTLFKLYEHRENTAYLAIMMNFCLGLRIGELVGLKSTDFDFETNLVTVRRQEVYVYRDGKKVGVRISSRMKTIDSKRQIPISPFCKTVYDLVMAYNRDQGIESDYLFISKKTGERMHANSVDKALNLANTEAGLEQRSIHKIRKTVLSQLDMSRNFTLEHIRELAGHSRQSIVLYTNYFYNIPGLEGISACKTFEEVVDYKMPALGNQDVANDSPEASKELKMLDFIPFHAVIKKCNSV